MSNKKQLKILRRLLLEKHTGGKLWLSLGAVCAGTTLLLFTVMIWWGYQQVLADKYNNDSLGSTYITLSKEVPTQKKEEQRIETFTYTEIDAINGLPQVQDVGVFSANKFPVKIVLNSTAYGFAHHAFLESIPNRFIDSIPIDWVWQYRNIRVPVIVPTSFFEIYNYGFALSDAHLQLSKKTAKSLAFDLIIGDSAHTEVFTMQIVGFSDRINSILVPQSFLDYGNEAFAPDMVTRPSRLIIKVSDPSDEQFVSFLKNRNYIVNSELLRWNKLRGVVDVVGYATGAIALFLLMLGVVIYILFIELRMRKAREHLVLLKILGYSPKFLNLFILKGLVLLLIPVYAISGLLVVLAQQQAVLWLKGYNIFMPTMPEWPVWCTLLLSFLMLVLLVARTVFKAVK